MRCPQLIVVKSATRSSNNTRGFLNERARSVATRKVGPGSEFSTARRDRTFVASSKDLTYYFVRKTGSFVWLIRAGVAAGRDNRQAIEIEIPSIGVVRHRIVGKSSMREPHPCLCTLGK